MNKKEFISPKKLQRFIPKQYYFWSSISPYYIPLFGKFFWYRLKKIIKIVLNLQEKLKKKFINILDIGCGIGFFSLNIAINNPLANINGIDILEEWQNKYIKKIFKKFNQNINLFTHDIQTKTKFPDENFDIIIALDVMEHVRELKSAIIEIKRILKKNGKFIITVPIESILLQYVRMIYAKISKRMVCNDHWRGIIPSIKIFDEYIRQEFNIELCKKYPISIFPMTLSYGMFYILSKV